MEFTTFPAYAQFMLDGYQVAPASAVDRIEMDDGFIQQASKQSLSRYEIPLTYRLANANDKDAFEAWRRVDLRNGALHFAWPDVADAGGTTVHRARIVNGTATYKPLTSRLDDWTVSFTLEYYA